MVNFNLISLKLNLFQFKWFQISIEIYFKFRLQTKQRILNKKFTLKVVEF